MRIEKYIEENFSSIKDEFTARDNGRIYFFKEDLGSFSYAWIPTGTIPQDEIVASITINPVLEEVEDDQLLQEFIDMASSSYDAIRFGY